jgi:uncharacterized protein (TIGR01777 family)
MRVVIAGASGLIGTPLRSALEARGDHVVPLGRGSGQGTWDPAAHRIDAAVLEGADAVINLAGESIGADTLPAQVTTGRWTEAKKQRLATSRLSGTALLVDAMSAMDSPPEAFVSASAMGYYGERGDIVLDEQAGPGSGFLAELVADWEAAALRAEESGVRVALARTSLVLTPDGGSLRPLLLPFRLGLGGPIGPGDQYWSWITLHDQVRALIHLLDGADLRGPFNLAAGSVTNREFVKDLGRALHRPAVVPLPAFALRLLLGRDFADEVLMTSTRIAPVALGESGFEFDHRTLPEAFDAIL